jgi:hypothetical protein
MNSMNFIYYLTKARPSGPAARDFGTARIVRGAKPTPKKKKMSLSRSNPDILLAKEDLHLPFIFKPLNLEP